MKKILLSNLGYARGIGGSLAHHVKYAHRHFYTSHKVQRENLRRLAALIAAQDPDICCLLEIDRGSPTSAWLNQLEELTRGRYAFFDSENKYAPTSRLRRFFMTSGKANAFMAKRDYPHEKIFFRSGHKKLVYKMRVGDGVILFFAHFSLSRAVRRKQIMEARALMEAEPGEALFMGDFNILTGPGELDPLLKDGRFVLLNRPGEPTFAFHRRRLMLDLAIATPGIARRCGLEILPQPFSDHAALLLTIRN